MVTVTGLEATVLSSGKNLAFQQVKDVTGSVEGKFDFGRLTFDENVTSLDDDRRKQYGDEDDDVMGDEETSADESDTSEESEEQNEADDRRSVGEATKR